MSENNLFELWLNESGELFPRMKKEKVSNRSLSEFFVAEVLKKKIKNFSPDDLVRNEHGKPELVSGDLSYNLSHCGDHLALVLCSQRFCGIDIQTSGSAEQFSDALRSVLTDREYAMLDETGIDDGFFQMWSLKEAYIKALGTSIWFGRDYDFSELLPDYSDRWIFCQNMYLFSTEIYSRVFLSLAVPSKPLAIDFRKL